MVGVVKDTNSLIPKDLLLPHTVFNQIGISGSLDESESDCNYNHLHKDSQNLITMFFTFGKEKAVILYVIIMQIRIMLL